MARTTLRPRPTATQTLTPLLRHGPTCGNAMGAADHHDRTITTLTDVVRLTRTLRRCLTPVCPQFRHPSRPAAAGRLALPQHAFGREVIAWIGPLRHAQHRRVPEIHPEWARGRVTMAPRTVQQLLERDDALVALSLADPLRLQQVTQGQGRVLLARDGRHPDVGPEVLGGLRACRSAAVLLARRRLSATQDDLATRLREVKRALGGPIVGVSSDGQPAIRGAVATAWPQVPHQLWHFHSLRAAAHPVYEADRHAKTARKKRVRGVRPLARQLAKRPAPEAAGSRGDGRAVRRALTDEGHPPLAAAGLTLHDRLSAISQRLERAANKGADQRPWAGGKRFAREG